jgi:glutathione S-transferase
MAELEILGVPFSNFVWACRICCAEKGVSHTLLPLRPHSPEVLAINPFGKVPAMRHGEVTLFESRAIIAYVDRAFDGPPLVPTDLLGAAKAEEWLSLLVSGIDQACMRQYVVPYAFGGGRGRPDSAAKIDAALPLVQKQVTYLEASVGGGTLLPSGFSAADALLVPILNALRHYPEGRAMLDAAPRLSAYLDRHLARPSVVETAPPVRTRT